MSSRTQVTDQEGRRACSNECKVSYSGVVKEWPRLTFCWFGVRFGGRANSAVLVLFLVDLGDGILGQQLARQAVLSLLSSWILFLNITGGFSCTKFIP